ncbi:MAG: ATP-binding cassette domain-containing protein [Clostridium sp.]|uniref:ATP-binding cassette domain-containing protein n=1 Tax=Clostridium sp. TaxID=1506 RepID=UPI003EE55361
MENILEVIGVNKKFARFKIEDINFSLKKGTVMGVIGANGAGKSTIIKSIIGINEVDLGKIIAFGENLLENPRLKEKIGIVYDTPMGIGNYRLEKNIRMIKKFYKSWDDSKFNYYSKKFSLDMFERLKNLSKGQELRYSLAIALSYNAELLILDEPTAGLDAVIRDELLDILFELVENEEISVLYSTHVTTDLERIADYITFVKKGRIEFSLEKDKLIEETILVKGKKEDLNEEIKKYLKGIRLHKYGFEAITNEKEKLKAINKSLVFEEASLDQIIVHLTKEG